MKRKTKRKDCEFCGKSIVCGYYQRHVDSCVKNPINVVYCEVCGEPTKNKNRRTCSIGCSNTFFRSGRNNPNWKDSSYRTTCFEEHEKKCVICGEDRIVEVHHLDGNKDNNSSENLIPLCPTHHRYWHSRYKKLILQEVYNCIENFKLK